MRFSSLAASIVMVTATLVMTATSTGCPTSDDKKCVDYNPPASFDPNTPVESFRNTVMPVFHGSCQFSSCHGSQSGNANGVFLGADGVDPAVVRAGLIDKPAPELPSLALIKPGDPRNSYLMRKMDGTNCLLDAQCKDGDCGG